MPIDPDFYLMAPVRIVENLMDGVRAARADSRRTDNNIADARAALDDLASDLPPVERARFWRAVFGHCASQVRRTAIKPPTPTAEWMPGGASYDAIAQEDRFDEDDVKGVSDDEA